MWAWIAGGGIGAAGAIVALWALWSRERANRRADATAAKLAATAKNLETIAAELDAAYAAAARQEDAFALLKGEIDGLEKELDQCVVPGSVRSRIRRMLSEAKTEPA